MDDTPEKWQVIWFVLSINSCVSWKHLSLPWRIWRRSEACTATRACTGWGARAPTTAHAPSLTTCTTTICSVQPHSLYATSTRHFTHTRPIGTTTIPLNTLRRDHTRVKVFLSLLSNHLLSWLQLTLPWSDLRQRVSRGQKKSLLKTWLRRPYD